ncbi:C2H2 finger domain-containing protein [Fusarium globosum]|uniref:C2H2 finger domain-containing protein n=1 Tax=Fusarium globosum TaxID=78864 RepID=A0A8H5XJ81_9HYPO|nr:C2H2 finger domain-containing protein [Fusarium globosum]
MTQGILQSISLAESDDSVEMIYLRSSFAAWKITSKKKTQMTLHMLMAQLDNLMQLNADGILTATKINAFFHFLFSQKTGAGERRLPDIRSSHTLKQYWKEFRLVYERETKRKIDPVLNRKMTRILRKLIVNHGLTGERRENRCMTIEDLERQAETTIRTTKQRFHIGEHRIYALLFLLLIAPSGSRPRALLFLRFGDLELSLARDPLGGPHRILIRFRLRFTKTFLGEKETNVLALPETIFDSSLLLSPHTLLLGLLFHHRAFDAPTLTSPEHLSKLNIHPEEHELPLPLKQSMNDIFVFRRATKTGMNAYVLSANEQITYNMIAGWTKKLGELAGFGVVVILYTLRYNAGNEFDQCSNISDGLRNLMLQHANSRTFEKHSSAASSLWILWPFIGYSASKRRPTHLTAEQSASINNDPKIQDLLRQRECLVSKGNKSGKIRTRLRKITKDIQSEKARLRRKRKDQVRKTWSREQAVTDIERQLAGKTFEEPPISPSDGNAHPAQKRLYEALTAPATNTIESEYHRRNNAILAVMSYCCVQEPPLSPMTRYKAATSKEDVSNLYDKPAKEIPSSALGDAITSVFVKNGAGRSRRCFLCVGRATTLEPSDPAINGCGQWPLDSEDSPTTREPPPGRQAARLSLTTCENRRVELKRDLKEEYQQGWSRHQGVVDIEWQLAGQTFEIAPGSPSDESVYDRLEGNTS